MWGIALSSAISGPRCVSVGKKLASQSPTLQKALKLAGILHDDPEPVKNMRQNMRQSKRQNKRQNNQPCSPTAEIRVLFFGVEELADFYFDVTEAKARSDQIQIGLCEKVGSRFDKKIPCDSIPHVRRKDDDFALLATRSEAR